MWISTYVMYARIIIEFTVAIVLFVQIWILNLVLTRNRGKPRRCHPHRRRTFPLVSLPSRRCPLAIGQNRNWDVRACALAFSSPSPLQDECFTRSRSQNVVSVGSWSWVLFWLVSSSVSGTQSAIFANRALRSTDSGESVLIFLY